MPYCSLEEAWGSDFYENEIEPKKFSKIENQYSNIDYPELNIYNENVEPILENEHKNKHKNKHKHKKSFSRNYNRLENHSGPKTRLPENKEYLLDNTSIESNHTNEIQQPNTINENFKQNNDYTQFLISENKELKMLINNYKNSNDGVFDLILFLSSGVFIIFLLDMVTKGIRRF